MRIGVIADTHMPRFGRALPEPLVRGLREAQVELILHLGDLTMPEVESLCREVAPFEAVAGNNDGPELAERWGRRRVLTLEGARIGMVHGDGGSGSSTPERAVRAFDGEHVDAILFGHSHMPLVVRAPIRSASGEIIRPWLVNPGSPTDKRREPRYSWALLEIRPGGELRAELRFFDRR